MNKKEIRKEYKNIRDSVKNKTQKSKIIMNKIIALPEYKKANAIAIYNSFSSELKTNKMIEHFLNDNKIVLLPKTVGKELRFYKINSLNDNLQKSFFGIFEPIPNSENYVDKDKIDLIIVPGISFDNNKNRLGYGGGYYDRFLYRTDTIKIGICFDEQIYIGRLPTNDKDIKMSLIISDKRII